MSPRDTLRADLGAHCDGDGVRFAVRAPGAEAVELCLVSREDPREEKRIPLEPRERDVYRGRVPALAPGALYAYRVHGRYAPRDGLRFNPAKRLVDPAARAIAGDLVWHADQLGYLRSDGPDSDRPDPVDSGHSVPPAIVIDERFDWAGDVSPRVPLADTLIYECHVKGLTIMHPDVPEMERGRYLGLAAEPVIAHLRGLGVTAVELLPVQHRFDERHLVERGLTNYWGYSPIGYAAPDPRFASAADGAQVSELKTAIKRLHVAGIEVILDVVFNHSGEGDHRGPTLSLKGFGNAAYYDLDPQRPERYRDFSGCGASLRTEHDAVRELVLESLRRWVLEYHVDGFRFDLAAALARERGEIVADLGILKAIGEDPTIASVKLIAEPWDAVGGSLLGRLPRVWSEWNGEYRDVLRRVWRAEGDRRGLLGGLASAIAGSSEVYARAGRGPTASVNFVATHDGPTLADLTTYARKHNEINGEDNRDGPAESFASNWGTEGATSDASIVRARALAQRNLLATVALSLGVPMLQHGDELGRSQLGLDNGYCQDNELSWVDWRLLRGDNELLGFARRAFAVRRSLRTFRRTAHFTGAPDAGGRRDLVWHHSTGREMTPADWEAVDADAVAGLYDGADVGDGWLLLLLNIGAGPRRFSLPANGPWTLRLATADLEWAGESAATVAGRSLALLQSASVAVGLR